MRWVGHVALMRRTGILIGFFVGKPEGKRRLGKQRCRWVDNNKKVLREIG
jgi:hypothetical protein